MIRLLRVAFRWLASASAAMLLIASPTARASTYEVLHHFDGRHGAYPTSGLAIDPSGTALYGTARYRWNGTSGVLYRLSSDGYKSLHYFRGGATDGWNPLGSLMVDSQGRVVGTTGSGGPADAGTVYRYDPASGYEMIFAFAGGAQGTFPAAALLEGSGGVLYGTAGTGGGACDCGTVFRLDPSSGVLTTLHTFNGTDGALAYSDLLRLGDRLYGVTAAGFAGDTGSPYYLNLDGTGFATVAPTDGGQEFRAGLTPDGSGNLWGVTGFGGDYGWGTIYRIDASGQHDVVFSFDYTNTGGYPLSKLVLSPDGMLYGTVINGGNSRSAGAIFRFDPVALTYSKLYQFTGKRDGAHPSTGTLVQDVAGAFYGVAEGGGKFGYGVVYKFTP